MQVRSNDHVDRYESLEQHYDIIERTFEEDRKRFFKLFTESTREGRKAAAREMQKIAARQTKKNQNFLLSHSVNLLMHTDSKKLRWPSSPLRIMLQFVDTNVRLGAANEEDPREGLTPLHHLSCHADPNDHSFHRNQVILGQQLFRHGASANLGAYTAGLTPLHIACHSGTVTNLDFIQLLLENGASANVQDTHGETPVMCAIPMAPGAAKFLLEWSTTPTTDINIHITNQTGATLLGMVNSTVEKFSNKAALPDSPERIKYAFLLEQWREIEKMLVERESH
jgi:hypothetical protein